MSPAYTYTDKYPDRSSQIPCMQQYQPWLGSVPPELRFDPSRYPVMQDWPCIGGHHNHPAACHPCHNYMAFPSYYCYPPPCPPMFQSQPLHYWGAYPGSPEVFPAQQVPPPGYWVERSRYEYDKNNAAQDHPCCGCPNHVCKPNAENGIKIEEQESNLETKGKDCNSLVPIYMRNHPYPIVWVSPEFMKNFEGGKLPKQKIMDSKDGSHEMEHGVKPVKEATPNSWFPLKMDKNFSPPEPVADQKGSENRQDGQNRRQFPFPIIWMPSYDKQEEEEVKDRMINSLRSSEKAPSAFKIFPVHPRDSRDDESREVGSNKKNSAHAELDKAGESVKQNTVKSCTDEDSENRQGTDYSDKRVKDFHMSTPGSKEKPSSPTKASKLPPVCLRVDSLPKRKSGGSRSPSPPDTKRGSSRDTSHKLKEVKVHDSPPHNENASKDTKKTEEVVKGIEVTGETRSNTNEVESRKDSNLGHFGAAKQEEDKTRSRDDGSASLENAKAEVVGAEGDKMETRSAKKSLSDVEAASLIQSAYRGYHVRKWDSLKKLKQMARVRDEVAKIRKSIDMLKSGSEDLTDQRRLVIGESIMRLLLQLDSIQGLHPSLRDIRKSLARELVHLQSELDSLASKQSDQSVKELSAASSEELRSQDVTHQQDEQAREMDGHLVQALPAENCDSRPKESEETQHQQSNSTCYSASKVDEAMQDESVALRNSVSEEGDRNIECQASGTCSEENLGNEHAEKLHTEEGGVASNEIEVVPPNQIGSESPMPLVKGKDEVNADGADNEIVNNCVRDKEDVNDASSDLAPRADNMDPVISGGESSIVLAELPTEIAAEESHEPYESVKQDAADAPYADNTDLVTVAGESNIDVMAELPTEIAAEEIHGSHESTKYEEADGETNLVLEFCDSSPETIEQPIAAEQDMFEGSKETMSDGNPCIELQPWQPEVPEVSLEGCKNIDAVPVPEDGSVEQVAKRETAFEDIVGFNGSDTLKDAEEVVQQAPVLEKEISSKVSEVPVKDGKEDPEEGCEEKELVDAEATRKPEVPEEKVVPVAHDQSVPSKASELSRADSWAPDNAAVDANEKLIEENEKLREMMEKLLEAGKDQLNVISDLTGRVQDLEKKLARTKKMRARRRKTASMRSRHGKLSPDSKKRTAGGVVV